MAVKRKPLQGVTNVIRFNWHFYVLAGIVCVALFSLANLMNGNWQLLVQISMLITAISVLISVIATYFIYDFSNLYSLAWLDIYKDDSPKAILNINAGFDETSELIQVRFPESSLIVSDFYDPLLHTEISIQRARKA